jgi:hypothetical protein
MNTFRLASFGAALGAALLCSACVIAPNTANNADLNKMSEQALQTCGAGNVKEVSAKSFSCK